MRCQTHCPQPTGFPWLTFLAAAAAALALWGISRILQAGRPILTAIGVAVLLVVGGMVCLFIADAIATTPSRERRPRYSELPALSEETPAPVAEPAYPPLRAVPDLEERAA